MQSADLQGILPDKLIHMLNLMRFNFNVRFISVLSLVN
ncbi:hypothetical protein D088_960013 [Salmonella enterica subsp. houtenae serovar 16:z4,z32:-- str. RKS3027]|nr:hypothetical protein D088_960013 [Salmonella enterica subsp. houtenae serovar 16:z4,z32:-- str. RKS3027]